MPVPLHPDDTIAALASAPGAAARGIIRVSGPRTKGVLESLFVNSPDGLPVTFSQPVPWCYTGALQISALSRPLPADIYLWPNRKSYTGQPLAEIHTLSSPPILEAILAELFARGVRPAQPGEFTLRAFLAGRIDLTQAEAVLGVIDASNERELQTALDQLAGGLSTQIVGLRSDLVDLLADLEAGLDFADEAIDFVSHAAIVGRLGRSRDIVGELLDRTDDRMRPAPQARVVLAGPPNAGKSTLFNALARARSALVSDVPGTTCDYLAVDVTIEGVPVLLVDTAGYESAAEGIGLAAQKLRHEQMTAADLVISCQPADELGNRSADGPDADSFAASTDRILTVVTKCDLLDAVDHSHGIAVSAQTGIGLAELRTAIASRLSNPASGARQFVGTTAARSRDSLLKSQAALDRALAIAHDETDQELLAIEIREALDELGKIAGAVYTDDILDRIFSRFCIGK